MTIALQIKDGEPWYLSPDIQIVDEDLATEVVPIASKPCFVQATVRNTGTQRVENATVRLYWAVPTTGLTRDAATLIGSAFVTLDPGAQGSALCLNPFTPSFLHGGHICLLAEAFHPSLDPLFPGFNVPEDRHLAQRNLTVIRADADTMMFHLPFQMFNPFETKSEFQIVASLARLDAGKLGKALNGKHGKPGKAEDVGFVEEACPTAQQLKSREAPKLKVALERKSTRGLTLVGRLVGDSAIVLVEQFHDRRHLGGIAVLVTKAKREQRLEEKES